MSAPVDLSNKKFNHLTCLYPTGTRNASGCIIWHCKCDCGEECDRGSSELTRGIAKACGKCFVDKDGIIRKIRTDTIKLTLDEAISRGLKVDRSIDGKQFGRLIVKSYAFYDLDRHKHFWNCECTCKDKTQIVVSQSCLTHKTRPTLSCGCIQRENTSKAISKHYTEHEKLLSERFTDMLKRCYNPRSSEFHRYGGRTDGTKITICDEWRFNRSAFIKWGIESGFRPDLTIDRIDNDGPYAPWNCRWVTLKDQQNNKSTNHKVTVRGITLNVTQWDEFLHLSKNRTAYRTYEVRKDEEKLKEWLEMKFDKRIKDLERRIDEADNQYWSKNDPIITDFEYDALIEELKKLDPTNSRITRVNGKISDTYNKVRHAEKLLSLDKAYTWNDLVSWCEKVARSENELFCLSPKYDGICVSIEDHRLITRGDGDVGTDITHLAPWILARFSYSKETVECSMHTIIEDQRFTLENKKQPKRYVGELLIPTDRFKKLKNSYPNIFGEMKNPRNTAAGFSMWKPDCDSLKELVYAGIPVPVCTWVNHRAHELTYPLKEIREHGDEIITKLRSYKKLPCDGIVCRLKDEEYGTTLGVTQHHPKSAIAYKFKDEAYYSVVTDVEWSLGNEAVTPVAVFMPVMIDSDEITRATCHNAKFVIDNNIVKGSVVTIERRGNVIPKIIKVVQTNNLKAKIPDKCPDCGQPLVYSNPDVLCVNQQCIGRITNKIFNGLHILGMNGIGPALIRRMCGCLYIPGIIEWCLESWDKDILIKKGFTAREIRLIKSEFERVSNAGVTDEAVFASLCIPQAGESFAKKVINYTGSIMTLLEPPETLKAKLKGCPGLNSTALNNVIDFMIEQDGASAFESYYNLFTHLRPLDADTRVKYCFTGALPHPRKELEEWVLDHGAYPTDRIAQANYLVSASPMSTSEKMKYAREHNIPVITFEQMMNQLSKGT